MNTTPIGFRSKVSNDAVSLKITPTSSPVFKPSQKSPTRPNFSSAILSLQKAIGTTSSSQCGFACHEDSRKIALCAGSAVLLAEFDEAYNRSQRFYRASPTASATVPGKFTSRSIVQNVTPDSRRRSLAPTRPATGTLMPASPNREWTEQESFKTWTSRKRIKAATSVAISHDGKFLAVGETGYNPRVLVFSTSRDAPLDTPNSIMTEHSSGIRNVAFNPDSQYLATLGDINDGFLYVFGVNRRSGSLKLHCTNKCTAWVRDMAWFGNNIITVGTRHVKVWRLPETLTSSPSKSGRQRFESEPPSSPGVKALSGRNVILGPSADFTFTCVAGISKYQAIIGSENGAIYLLDDTHSRQELKLIKYFDWSVFSVAIGKDKQVVWFGGSGHRTFCENIDALKSLGSSPTQSGASSEISVSHPASPISQLNESSSSSVIAVGCLGEKLVCLDSDRNLGIRDSSEPTATTKAASIELLTPAHSGPIEGVRTIQKESASGAFFTWSRDGNVRFWDLDGLLQDSMQIEVEQWSSEDEPANELKSLCASPNEAYYISGDLLGVVRLMKRAPWSEVHHIKAHSSEITNIAVADSTEGFLLATAGRDRIIQLFHKTENDLCLVQTMDEHVGSVTGLLFTEDGDRLISYSSDRTILIRQRFTKPGATAIYFLQRVVTLKASPVSLALHPHSPDILLVSTMDRCISRFDMSSGSQIHSFKTSDPEDNDTVIMGSLSISRGSAGNDSPLIIAGVSSTDKSIRIYDYAKDSLLTREFGHTEGVSDIALLEATQNTESGALGGSKRTIISTGLDGMIMLWEFSLPSTRPLQDLTQATLASPKLTPVKDVIAGKAPIRRVLSRSDLAEYTRFDPSVGTTTPIRDQSPPRVRRRQSKYGSITSTRSETLSDHAPSISAPSLPPIQAGQQSPSIKKDLTSSSTKFLSDGAEGDCTRGQKESESCNGNQRPISTQTESVKQPLASQTLRRSPSIPTNLRSFNRSKSSSNLRTEFGTVNAAGDQTSRALRAYRKKIEISHNDEIDARILEDVEKELQATVNSVRKKLESLEKRLGSVRQNSQNTEDDDLAFDTNASSVSNDSFESQSEGSNKNASKSMASKEASGEG